MPPTIPRVLCIIPAHPNEHSEQVVQCIKNQTIPIQHIEVLTELINERLSFPARISKVINNYLVTVDLTQYDILFRADTDTRFTPNFLEENLKKGYDALGYGYAQIIKMPIFIKVFNGRMNPDHDDGYILVKLHFTGYKANCDDYAVKPILLRKSGFHHGSSWFAAQGELNYMYGDDPINVLFNTLYSFNQYTIFQICGYFKALLTRKKRFDIALPVIQRHMLKFRHPMRFFRLGIYIRKKLKEQK